MRVAVIALLAALVVACTGEDAPPASTASPAPAGASALADTTRSAPAGPPPTSTRIVVIDWVDFIHIADVRYLRARPPSSIDESDLGAQVSTVRFKVSENVSDPSYRAQDGDAAFLDAGTPVYAVRGYDPKFRLAARSSQTGRLNLYEADSNPGATHGGDLLDIGGKVTRIAINSETDGTTELAAIDDPSEVAALTDLVLAAPIAQDSSSEREGRRHFIAFHLADGTQVVRAYWPGSGELHRGIMLPPAFATAIERALAGR